MECARLLLLAAGLCALCIAVDGEHPDRMQGSGGDRQRRGGCAPGWPRAGAATAAVAVRSAKMQALRVPGFDFQLVARFSRPQVSPLPHASLDPAGRALKSEQGLRHSDRACLQLQLAVPSPCTAVPAARLPCPCPAHLLPAHSAPLLPLPGRTQAGPAAGLRVRALGRPSAAVTAAHPPLTARPCACSRAQVLGPRVQVEGGDGV